jgi:hypothetical protein
MIHAGAVLIALAIIQGSERVEVDPVTCWWRTSAAAVRVGEPFGVVLTCSLLQTEAARVVVIPIPKPTACSGFVPLPRWTRRRSSGAWSTSC